MNRSDMPNAAFGYVGNDGAYRMLLHHDPERVKTGKEHGTVDPMLLFAALCLVESIQISESDRDRVRADLQSHADVLFAFENDGSPAPDFKLWEDEDTDGLPIAMHDKLRDFAFFKANMDGASEVPPVQTEGRGSAYIAYNKRTKEMSWWIEHLDLVATENAAHFHIGRSGKPGPIEIPLELGNMKNCSSERAQPEASVSREHPNRARSRQWRWGSGCFQAARGDQAKSRSRWRSGCFEAPDG